MTNNITYGEWLRNWINIYKKPYIKSWKLLKTHIKNHVPLSLSKTKLKYINAVDVQKAINDIPTSRMRLEMFDIYHGSLTMAYKVGFIERDIAQVLIKPKHVRKLGVPLTDGEIIGFLFLLRNSNCRCRFALEFLLLTGCRRSECLSVKWSDIFMSDKIIHIKGTKTAFSDRYIPITADLSLLLARVPKKGELLFNFKPDYLSRSFHKFCPSHKLHDLRHTFATKCVECGINISVLQMWLGHTRLDTTARIYTHIRPEFILQESDKFKLF